MPQYVTYVDDNEQQWQAEVLGRNENCVDLLHLRYNDGTRTIKVESCPPQSKVTGLGRFYISTPPKKKSKGKIAAKLTETAKVTKH